MDARSQTGRLRGRPRSTSVDRALLGAALAEFTANGFHGMSMEGIAARAGVSKVSLYRRWSSKLAVAAELLQLMASKTVPADQGSFKADILYLLKESIGSKTAKAAARVLMRTMGEISGSPELLALYRKHLFGPRTEQLRVLVERARARQEIRAGLPTDIAATMIAGPLFLYHLNLLVEPDADTPANLAEQLARSILQGIGAVKGAAERADETIEETEDRLG